MNVYDESKSEQFLRLLKEVSYPNVAAFSAKNFDYLFGIRETRPFFDWFLANVTDECYLTREELAEFQLRAAKGQVIWDLARLEDLSDLMHNQKAETGPEEDECIEESADSVEQRIEILKRDMQFKENQLKLMSGQCEFNQFSIQNLSEHLASAKQKQNASQIAMHKLAEKEALLKSAIKQTNQNLGRLFAEFQVKFGDEEKLNNIVTSSTSSGNDGSAARDTPYEGYLNLEKSLAAKIKALAFIEIDCVSFRSETNRRKLNEFNSLSLDRNELSEKDKELIEWVSNAMNDTTKQNNIEKILKLCFKKYKRKTYYFNLN
jgi:hypothetical protein